MSKITREQKMAVRESMDLIKTNEVTKILELLEDEDLWVQLWAASHSLEIDEVKALKKLTEIQEAGIPLVSSSAKYTIEAWNAGELRYLSS